MAVSVRMDAVLETQLTLAAQRRGISKSQFIIDAVQRALGHNDPGDLLLQVRKEFAPLRAAESKAGGPLVPMNSHAQRVRAAIRAKHDAERAAAREASKTAKKTAASSKRASTRSGARRSRTRTRPQRVKLALIDAGPLISLFDPDDEHHARYDALLTSRLERWQLHTTWPVIAEVSHMLRGIARLEMLRFVGLGGVQVFPLDALALLDMAAWMQTYSEPPRSVMDLADASLYWLARDTGVTRVMTIDRRDFLRYRLPDGRGFEIV